MGLEIFPVIITNNDELSCHCDQLALMFISHLGSGKLYDWLRLIERQKACYPRKRKSRISGLMTL